MAKTVHVSMVLKQNKSRQRNPDEESVYKAFRARCKKKSEHNYVDRGDEPVLLRLYLLGSKFNSTVEFLVKYGSFEPIMGKTPGTENNEIGFEVELKSLFTSQPHKLTVWKRQFKATMTIPNVD